MATAKNPKGREYKNGVGTSKDLRLLIVQEIIEHGGNVDTGEVPKGYFYMYLSLLIDFEFRP